MRMRDIMTINEVANASSHVPLASEAEGEILRAFTDGNYIIARMSPDQYIRLARMRRNPAPLPDNLGGNMDRLRADIERNGLKQLPWIVIEDNVVTDQEGLHRAAVLRGMGYESIPVRVFTLQDGDPLEGSEARRAWKSLLGH